MTISVVTAPRLRVACNSVIPYLSDVLHLRADATRSVSSDLVNASLYFACGAVGLPQTVGVPK